MKNSILDIWINYTSRKRCLTLDPEPSEVLNEAEIKRMLKYNSMESRKQFTASRSFLKYVLGQYMGCPPNEIQIRYQQNGKPYVCEGPEFNLSHTKFLTSIVVASCPVGIDIEKIRKMQHVKRIASRFLTPFEQTYCLSSSNNREQTISLLNILTRKEAFAKATGLGIGGQWLKFNTMEDNYSWIRHPKSEHGEPYTTRSLHFSDNYIGAVCYKGTGFMRLKYHICNDLKIFNR
ncbi:4'-phosphopantetheinyl transferase family protein [Paenibacillus sp. An7]|uniref:4'-phosphopantetheinyl transferase family protein n=1 Tax=Paenibacillus sp. An7 TaxID=2689577 RepID=UPI0013567951|nr:4'-phosphopantetheinyl transferase superfamily protein [Paenibacillus sp. An7]